MITLYSGTPGSGKSIHAAQTIIDKLKMGRAVIANFDINREYFKKKSLYNKYIYRDNYDITPEYLMKFSYEYFKENKFREGAILLIIDEAQLLFNAREWNIKGRNEWLSFFTQHRKYGYNIILITQFDRMLDRQIRALIEYEEKHRKVANAGIIAWILSRFVGGRIFAAVTYWYAVREKMGVSFMKPSKKIFTFYNSYKDFGTFEKLKTDEGNSENDDK